MTSTDACDDDDAQRVALAWILRHACDANVQLATLSNVCRRWRDVAVGAVAEEAVGGSEGGRGQRSGHRGDGRGARGDAAPSSLRGLLIADMAREMVARRREKPRERGNGGNNFCLAWFAPSGIRATSVSLEDGDGAADCAADGVKAKADEWCDDDGGGFQFDFCGGDANGEVDPKPAQPRGRGRKARSAGKSVTCCSEWRGYRHASEVLIPFGYASSFVRNVLDASSQLALGVAANNTAASSAASSQQRPKPLSHQYNPTFAVRGATLARPEGFCLCVDDDYIAHAGSSDFEAPSHATTHSVPSCVDGWLNDYCDNGWPLRPLLGLAPAQRKRKQRMLTKCLLPRMVLSTRRKYPLLHRFADEDGEEDDSEGRQFAWERRQRAVQFLNADKKQAIKLITPRFECGPVRGPITMFLVGITTEDGCFLSGRSTRFEFGHLYPLSSRDMQFDISPIAIATEKKEEVGGEGAAAADRAARGRDSSGRVQNTPLDNCHNGCIDSSDSDRSAHCLCKFDSGDPFNPVELNVEDPSEDCVHRGCTGPGLWHCYVAVFDGKRSVIRVDGCVEPKRTREHYGLAASDDDDADNVANASSFVGSGFLDGLSLGSDHQFDMSLCYGEVEGDCGQGAIAELAVFNGRMEDPDIEKLEQYLMKKHGILSVRERKAFVAEENRTRRKPLNIECHLQEDEWQRQAHALIEQRRPWNLTGSVPLRVAANHPSVSWHRKDAITGSSIRIARIGAKNSNGSSDW